MSGKRAKRASRTNFQKYVIRILGEFLSSGMKSDGVLYLHGPVYWVGCLCLCDPFTRAGGQDRDAWRQQPHLTNLFRELFQDRVHHG